MIIIFQGKRTKGDGPTVSGLGSKILLISFFALEDNQGGNVKSALNIYNNIKSLYNQVLAL